MFFSLPGRVAPKLWRAGGSAGDDDFASRVPGLDVGDGLAGGAERKGLVDDGDDPLAVEQVAEDRQIIPVLWSASAP
uniref:hypothetical protein n=1 Tax=Paractinoplanes polyasparticus TaxID=2856853 RepID=UPI003F68D007